MAKKETTNYAAPVLPMLKTVEQMSKVSGIGENKLRELMDNGELEYVQNGNRRLIADTAIWDWYERAKTAVKPPAEQGGYGFPTDAIRRIEENHKKIKSMTVSEAKEYCRLHFREVQLLLDTYERSLFIKAMRTF